VPSAVVGGWVRRLGWLLSRRGRGRGGGRGRGAGKGDFEAEGFDLADVVGDLAAGGGLPFVVAEAEVLVSRAGVGQQLVLDPELCDPQVKTPALTCGFVFQERPTSRAARPHSRTAARRHKPPPRRGNIPRPPRPAPAPDFSRGATIPRMR
jgi:hypothetical protein